MNKITHISKDLAICTNTNPKYKPKFNATNENINWAAFSWNPVTGCLKACPWCYARKRAENDYFKSGFPTGFKPTFHPARLLAPSNTSIPKDKVDLPGIRRVFVCSMADLFGDWVPAEWIQSVIDTCADNTQWDFLLLTKNPKRYQEFTFPLNCWLGATADTQTRADRAIAVFKNITGNIKFLSSEPLMAPITFTSNSLTAVDLLILGALKGSECTVRQPDRAWVAHLVNQAVTANCLYLYKPNLTALPAAYPDSPDVYPASLISR